MLDGVAVTARQRHRARAAPALAARLLRAGQSDLVRAEVVDQQRARVGVVDDVQDAVDPEANRIGHGHIGWYWKVGPTCRPGLASPAAIPMAWLLSDIMIPSAALNR